KPLVSCPPDNGAAVRPGGRVAGCQTGGRLVQVDPPETLLARPANDFVAGFIGHDRGIRRLSFVPASSAPLSDRDVLPADTPAGRGRDGRGERVLAVHADRRPRGWAAVRDLPASGVLGDAPLAPIGHAFDVEGDSVRAALDAAILSPSGRAVGVDAEGRVVGIADQQDLSTAIARSGAAVAPRPAADGAATAEGAAGGVSEGADTGGGA